MCAVAKRNENNTNLHLIEDRKVLLERERQKYHSAKDALESAKSSTTQAEATAREAEEAVAAKERDVNAQLSKLKVNYTINFFCSKYIFYFFLFYFILFYYF